MSRACYNTNAFYACVLNPSHFFDLCPFLGNSMCLAVICL